VVVTYFPDDSCLANLETLLTRCDRLVIVDNTPGCHTASFPEGNNATVIKLGMNIGLAAALNRGIDFAGQSGYENIFLFDQDSRQPQGFFREMLSFKSEVDRAEGKFAFYVPDFLDRNSRTSATFPVIRRFTLRHVKCTNMPFRGFDDAVMAVTSGTLLKYSAFEKLGPFREDYFIDFVDNEYCLRAYKFGYEIAVNCAVVLDHSIGRRSTRKIFFLTLKPNFHSPVRRYYIARNGVRTAIEFGCERPVYLGLVFARLCHEVLSILLCEDRKVRKLHGCFWGAVHGITGRMGPCHVVSLLGNEGK